MGCSSSMGRAAAKKDAQGVNKIRAALFIQRWYRRYIARAEMRRRCTWKIFQSLEYAGEQDQLKLHNFFNNMLTNMSRDSDGQAPLIKAFHVNKRGSIYDTKTFEDPESEMLKTYLDNVTIEPSYKGPHLTFPLTLNQLNDLVQAFKRRLSLHAYYTIQLLLEMRRLLKTQANIRHASTSLSNQFTICGDIHGKLTDLFMIFYKNGLPAVDNPYIFNGDFVDRGTQSTEVALLLFACALMNPNEVFINRGNHEDHVMNVRYGFTKEIHLKYTGHAKKINRLFQDVFSWLPLATVIDEQIFVCHGGISDTTDLDILSSINRHAYHSILQPPGSCDDIMTLPEPQLIEWKQVLDILWSDPRSTFGCHSNSFRGGGSYFGPDVTEKFLAKNNLKLLVRSHECKLDGYEYTHDGMVLTVFSCSNYYDVGSNRGAYIKVMGPDLTCHFMQYMSTHTPTFRRVTFSQRVNHVEQTAIQDLKTRIVASKTELLLEFRKYDSQNTGLISSFDWCFALEAVLEMELPWRTLKSKLVHMNEDGSVNYMSSFDDNQIRHRYSGNGPSITETLYKHRDNLETIFRLIDKDQSGWISMEEFGESLTLLTRQLDLHLTGQDIHDIAKSLDINKDGRIDFNEFLEAFRIVDSLGREKNSISSLTNGTSQSDKLGNKLKVPTIDSAYGTIERPPRLHKQVRVGSVTEEIVPVTCSVIECPD